MFKVKGKYIRAKYIRSRVFIVNFEHISYLFLVFLLLTYYNKCYRLGGVMNFYIQIFMEAFP